METHGEQARVRRCGRALRRFLITASAIVILIIALTTWLGGNMREAMAALASARIRAVSAKAMNDAILDTMESNSAYTALLHIRENGTKVYMVQADPACRAMRRGRPGAHSRAWRAGDIHTYRHDNRAYVPFRKGAEHTHIIYTGRKRTKPVQLRIYIVRNKPNVVQGKS